MVFRVGLTHDFKKEDGSLGWGDIGLSCLDDHPDIVWSFLPDYGSELPPEVVADYDALLVLSPRVTGRTLADPGRLKLIARFGVGYDSVDVPACTKAGVLLAITPDGVRRPVAVGALTLLLAVTQNVLAKDRLTRSGRWQDRMDYMGFGLTGRLIGIVGLGNTGREFVTLTKPLELRYQAFDPYVRPEIAASLGVELVDLRTLMATSDIVCVMAALSPETRHLLGADELALMKPTAYLVNVARGAIIDQAALTDALAAQRIRGAALDVFETEPADATERLFSLPNVVTAPHSICWTDELGLGMGRSALQAVIDVAEGRRPRYVVNPEATWSPATDNEEGLSSDR